MQFTIIYSPSTAINNKKLELEDKRSRKHPKIAFTSKDNCDQTRAQNNDPTVQNEALDVRNKLPKFEDEPSVQFPRTDRLLKPALKTPKMKNLHFFSILCVLFLKTTHPILVTCLPQDNLFKTSRGSHNLSL